MGFLYMRVVSDLVLAASLDEWHRGWAHPFRPTCADHSSPPQDQPFVARGRLFQRPWESPGPSHHLVGCWVGPIDDQGTLGRWSQAGPGLWPAHRCWD